MDAGNKSTQIFAGKIAHRSSEKRAAVRFAVFGKILVEALPSPSPADP